MNCKSFWAFSSYFSFFSIKPIFNMYDEYGFIIIKNKNYINSINKKIYLPKMKFFFISVKII